MYTTKMLCRLFDNENKGYVTILDMIQNTLRFCVFCVIVLFLIYGIYLHYIVFIIQTTMESEMLDFERICFTITGIIGSISGLLFIVGLLLFTLEKCDNIKVVQCKK